jgi:hypothetical protein
MTYYIVMTRTWYQVINSTGPGWEHGKWKVFVTTQFDSFKKAARFIEMIPVDNLDEFKIVKFQ